VNPSTIVEFLDPDGSYIRARALDEVCCRVLSSNVARKGEVYVKEGALDWEEASEDLGGLTRLGPWDLAPLKGRDPEEEDLLATLEAIPYSKDVASRELEGPRALLDRLIRGSERLTRGITIQLLDLPLKDRERDLLLTLLRRVSDSSPEEGSAA
jgi:hypothetical protein